MNEKSTAIALGILEGAGNDQEKFQIASIMIVSGFMVAMKLIRDKKVGTLQSADLLFDLRNNLAELEKGFRGQ